MNDLKGVQDKQLDEPNNFEEYTKLEEDKHEYTSENDIIDEAENEDEIPNMCDDIPPLNIVFHPYDDKKNQRYAGINRNDSIEDGEIIMW